MATLAFAAGGAAIGSYFGMPGLGWTIGMMVGSMLFPPTGPSSDGPRLADRTVQTSTYGLPIPVVFGAQRIAGNVIWATDIVEQKVTTDAAGAGKGGLGGSGGKNSTYNYYGNFAVALCRGPVQAIGRIWLDAKLMTEGSVPPPTLSGPLLVTIIGKYSENITFYYGTEDQMPDPAIQADKGTANTPAFRGMCYIVFKNLPLADFGNRLPNVEAEVIQANASEMASNPLFISANLPAFASDLTFKMYGSDSFGSAYACNRSSDIYGLQTNGNTAFHWTSADVANAVNGWWGSVACTVAAAGFPLLQPIMNGQWLIGTISDNSWCFMFLARPNAAGAPTVVGATRFARTVLASAPTAVFQFLHTQDQTMDSPLLLMSQQGLGLGSVVYLLCPTPNQLLTPDVSFPGTTPGGPPHYVFQPRETPYVAYFVKAASGNDIGKNFTTGNYTVDGIASSQGSLGSWCLPKILPLASPPTITTMLFAYLNRSYMDGQVAGSGSGQNDEVKLVLGPAHPNGSLIQFDIGDGFGGFSQQSFAGFVAAPWTTANTNIANFNFPNYTEVSAAVVDQGNLPLLPFADEWHHLDGSFGDHVAYNMKPFIYRSADFSYIVAFNATPTNTYDTVGGLNGFCKVRAFQYDPVLARFVQFGNTSGTTWNPGVLGGGTFPFGPDDWDTQLYYDGTNLFAWGSLGDFRVNTQSGAYFTRLGPLSITGHTNLGTIVASICQSVGMQAGTDFDVSQLNSIQVDGYMVSRQLSAVQSIAPLQAAFFFDAVESNGLLKFVLRNGTPIATIPEDDLATRESSADKDLPKVVETRKQDAELPRRVYIAYSSKALDYQIATQQEKRLKRAVKTILEQSLEAPIVLSDNDAKQIVVRTLYLAWLMRTTFAFSLPYKYLVYDPTDVVTLTFNGFTIPVYLTDLEVGADMVLNWAGLSTDAIAFEGISSEGPPLGVTAQSTAGIEPMATYLLDIQLLTPQSDDFGFYVAGRGLTSRWKGGVVYRSTDGSNFFAQMTVQVEAITGKAVTVLPAATSCLTDRVNTVTVQLDETDATLTSCAYVDMLSNVNLALLGNEIIGFETAAADPVIAGRYVLSGLRRGVQGSEWALGTHAINENFIMLKSDGSTQSMTQQESESGISRSYAGSSFGIPLDPSTAVAFSNTNRRLKPLAPVHIAGTRSGPGDIALTWFARARIDGDWRDFVETPIDEPVEAYEVDILSGLTVVRTLTATSPAVSYSTVDQTTDFGGPQASVSVNVYQLSTRVGRGFPGSATV